MAKQNTQRQSLLIGSGVVLGVVAGFLLRDALKDMYARARRGQWHRQYERTVSYGENLPDQLERREPASQPGQPRFGGTGALGVSPVSGM